MVTDASTTQQSKEMSGLAKGQSNQRRYLIRVEQVQVRRGLIRAGQLVLANRSRHGNHYPLS